MDRGAWRAGVQRVGHDFTTTSNLKKVIFGSGAFLDSEAAQML